MGDERTPIGEMSMGLDLDTSKLKRKLRTIAKHAEALADELDEIDADDEP